MYDIKEILESQHADTEYHSFKHKRWFRIRKLIVCIHYIFVHAEGLLFNVNIKVKYITVNFLYNTILKRDFSYR